MAVKKIRIKTEEEQSFESKELRKILDYTKKYLKPLIIVLALVLVSVLYKVVIKPIYGKKNKKAHREMFNAIYNFEEDKLDLALNGDSDQKGFLYILQNYKNTQAEQLANFYVGSIYLKKGEYSTAISHLKKYNLKDLIIQRKATELIGDALSQQGSYKEAATKYKEAADYKPSESYSANLLRKASLCMEKIQDIKTAIIYLSEILEKYPDSKESKYAIKRKSFLST